MATAIRSEVYYYERRESSEEKNLEKKKKKPGCPARRLPSTVRLEIAVVASRALWVSLGQKRYVPP